MKCPICGAWSRVLETRGTARRRECANLHRFSTTEVVVVDNAERDRAVGDAASELEDAKQARDLLVRKARGTRAEIAARFGLSQSQIYRIKRNERKNQTAQSPHEGSRPVGRAGRNDDGAQRDDRQNLEVQAPRARHPGSPAAAARAQSGAQAHTGRAGGGG